ncbi:restriction endonuclease subunit S [Kiloniella sp.]|uniref:restriction endonuclease subunit S n=1 Tax=Kiloniella sp. TaxID=1938587 RepID=UPI003A916223
MVWNSVKLSELISISHGFAFKGVDFNTDEDTTKPIVLTPGNYCEDGALEFTAKNTKRFKGKLPNDYLFNISDLTVVMTDLSSKMKILGKPAFIERDNILHNQRIGRIKFLNSNVLPRYVYFFLRTKEASERIKKTATGTMVRHTAPKRILELNLQLPRLEEQKRIVAILDEAFAGIDKAIDNTEKNLANAKELFESYLNNIFTQKGEGWVETSLDHLCSIKHGFAFKSEYFVQQSDYIVLTPGSFYERGGFRDQGIKTKYYKGEIPDGYILRKDNFLIAMTEQAVGLLGSSLIVPADNKYLHNQRLGLVEVLDGVNWDNGFFLHQFSTKKFRALVQETATGLKVRHTSPTKLGNVLVSYPKTLEEQKMIARKLNSILDESLKLEVVYNQKLTALKELKQSLLQKAFAGELTTDMRDVA